MRCLAALVLLGLLGHTVGVEVICYWGSWTSYRTGNGKVTVDDLDPKQCTIYIYSFATLDEDSLTMKEFDTNLDINMKGYEKFVTMKRRNPALRVLLALGGYNDSRGSKYSTMLASASKRARFVRRAVAFLRQHGFDGLDLDYEYPTTADRPHFADLVVELKQAFRPHGLWLSTATPATRDRIDAGFDVPKIAASIDMIHVMAYDLHGSWEWSRADHHAPLLPRSSDTGRGFDVQSTVDHWLRRGAPASKLALGIPAYGRSWRVPGPEKRPPAKAAGAGQAGPYSAEAGSLTYLEICEKMKAGWTVVRDPSGKIGPYAYSGDQWVGYDDPAMAAEKTRYAVRRGLGGVMIWDVGSSDVRNVCGNGAWPLLTAMNANLGGRRPTGSSTSARPTAVPATPSTTRRSQVVGTTTRRTVSTAGRFKCPRDGVFPDPDDCTSFYVCSTEQSRCPPGSAFSAVTGSCSAVTAGCAAATTTTARPSGRFACPHSSGLYADPLSCRRYYSCLDGKPMSRACPAGTGWDSRISSCNWDFVIGCRD